MSISAVIMPCGKRLHLQHGPIDLIIGADGDRQMAFEAAAERFRTVLTELVDELPLLRHQIRAQIHTFKGTTAQRMAHAVAPHFETFVTPMAAVAGAVADEVLQAMCKHAPLRRGYVNNGGDIALFLSPGAQFTSAMMMADGTDLGQIKIQSNDPIRGMATSGRHGRSLSLGIADSVTALAQNAAAADVAATLIANAIDVPNHPLIDRQPASVVQPDSDLGTQLVTTHCGKLSRLDVQIALQNGQDVALRMLRSGLISAASLHLQGASLQVGNLEITAHQQDRGLIDA